MLPTAASYSAIAAAVGCGTAADEGANSDHAPPRLASAPNAAAGEEDGNEARGERPNRARQQSQPPRCRFGFYCDNGLQYDYWHSDEEQALFKKHGGHGVRGYKSQLCAHFAKGSCVRGRDCNFAHGAFCSMCLRRGHFVLTCKSSPAEGGAGESEE